MTWENYGEWEIDHIIPQSLFSIDEIRDCWALANIRPLWKKENLLKNKAVQLPAQSSGIPKGYSW